MDYLLLITGWVLGILSAAVIEKFKKQSEKKEIKKGIITELRDSQMHLASICYVTTFDHGEFSVDFLKWWKPNYPYLSLVKPVRVVIRKPPNQVAFFISTSIKKVPKRFQDRV